MRVAVVAPSGDLAGRCTWMREQGVRRLEALDLVDEVVLFPTATKTDNTPQERALDLNRAFADPGIQAIFCTIGGDDCIRIIPFLDKEMVLKGKGKLFFGYSDITHLHMFLLDLGIRCCYGASILCQFGISGKGMQAQTLESVKACLAGIQPRLEAPPAIAYRHEESGADDPTSRYIPCYRNWFHPDRQQALEAEPLFAPHPGWVWENLPPAGCETAVEGKLFGGCLEVLLTSLAAGQVPSGVFDPRGEEPIILFLETSEEMPSHSVTRKMLQALASRKFFRPQGGRCAAILFGIPCTRFLDKVAQPTEEEFMLAQRTAVLDALSEFGLKGEAPVLFNMPFGHTDPQIVIPYGCRCRLDPVKRCAEIEYAPAAPSSSPFAAL